MTEQEMIKAKRAEGTREEWVAFMRARKALQEQGKTPEEIVEALS